MSRILKSSYINLNKDEAISINNYTYFGSDAEENLENDEASSKHQATLAHEQAILILEEARFNARLEADAIIAKANQEIEQKKQEIYESSKNLGYEEGMKKAEEDILAKENELNSKIKENEEIREKTLIKLEKEIVQFVIDLTKKVLTKSFEIRPEVIGFLVQKGLTQVKNFENLKIYVSEQQYDFVENNKNEILGIDTQNYHIQIIKDTTLSDTECLIETDFGTINCSCLEQFEGIKNTLAYMLE